VIVYVESNFVLEIALLQEEHESCAAIIDLSESKSIDLVIPGFSIGEPYEVWGRRSRQRRELHQLLTREMRELSRSSPYTETVENSSELASMLIQSADEDKQRLTAALSRILECAVAVAIGAKTLGAAIEFQNSLDLSPQDSIVYASVLSHLSSAPTGPKCFLNKDSKGFANSLIEEQLAAYDCRLITRFADGLRYIYINSLID
jgi:predicted nucleic acid-binding protein